MLGKIRATYVLRYGYTSLFLRLSSPDFFRGLFSLWGFLFRYFFLRLFLPNFFLRRLRSVLHPCYDVDTPHFFWGFLPWFFPRLVFPLRLFVLIFFLRLFFTLLFSEAFYSPFFFGGFSPLPPYFFRDFFPYFFLRGVFLPKLLLNDFFCPPQFFLKHTLVCIFSSPKEALFPHPSNINFLR